MPGDGQAGQNADLRTNWFVRLIERTARLELTALGPAAWDLSPVRVTYLAELQEMQDREREVAIARAVRVGTNADKDGWAAWVAAMRE